MYCPLLLMSRINADCAQMVITCYDVHVGLLEIFVHRYVNSSKRHNFIHVFQQRETTSNSAAIKPLS